MDNITKDFPMKMIVQEETQEWKNEKTESKFQDYDNRNGRPLTHSSTTRPNSSESREQEQDKYSNLNLKSPVKIQDGNSKFSYETKYKPNANLFEKSRYVNCFKNNYMWNFYNYNQSKIYSLEKIGSYFKLPDFRTLTKTSTIANLPHLPCSCFNKKTSFLQNGSFLNILYSPKIIKKYTQPSFKSSTVYKLCHMRDFSNESLTYLRPNFLKRSYTIDLISWYKKCFFPRQSRINGHKGYFPNGKQVTQFKLPFLQAFSKNLLSIKELFKFTRTRLPLTKSATMNTNEKSTMTSPEQRSPKKDTPKISMALKLAQIRQNVRKLHHKIDTEIERKDLQRLKYIEKMQELCTSTSVSPSEFERLSSNFEKQCIIIDKQEETQHNFFTTDSTFPNQFHGQKSSQTNSNNYFKRMESMIQIIPYVCITIPVCVVLGIRFAFTTFTRNILCCF